MVPFKIHPLGWPHGLYVERYLLNSTYLAPSSDCSIAMPLIINNLGVLVAKRTP